MRTRMTHNERGIALIMVMLLTVAVAAMAAGAIFLTSSATLVARGQEREEEMRNAADAGIEFGRSTLNGGSVVLDTIYRTLVLNQQVNDANGVAIPGITRSIYYGPTGSSTGQYGIFASIVSVITDRSGAVVVRRGELAQESFARFAYYTDDEGSGICFGNGDNIFGPVHTNDDMCIYSSGVHFFSEVEVAGVITGKSYGIFDVNPPIERGAVIPLPTIAQLAQLNTYATQGGMSYVATNSGSSAQARTRVEFVALDLDNDGRVSGPEEGFFKIYEQNIGAANPAYVMASRIASPDTSRNCGHYHTVNVSTGGTRQVFVPAWEHRNSPGNVIMGHTGGTAAEGANSANESLRSGTYRCYLGGSEQLFIDSVPGLAFAALRDYRNTFRASDAYGNWRQFTNVPDARVIAALKNAASAAADTTLANRTLYAQYLFPLSRTFNPNTKGVIYVANRIALSGVLNARLTLASNDNIIIADDLRYAVTPGSAPCLGANILGLLSPDTVFLANNAINAPWDYTAGAGDNRTGAANSAYRNYDESDGETIMGVILTLRSFYNESHGTGADAGDNVQPCGATAWGRGCLFLTGGIIQDQRGAVGTTGGTGTLKRYSYDVCAFQTPPPYFPTTGRYLRNRYYEIDPVGFNVANFYASLIPAN